MTPFTKGLFSKGAIFIISTFTCIFSKERSVEIIHKIELPWTKNYVGFSVGEITSLIFSGALTFEDGVKLVNIRQIAMQQASDIAPSGMMTIFFPASAEVELACDAAR